MVVRKKDKGLELSAERSRLAVQRTILANARTFSAWIRTGLSIVLAGLAIVGFIGEVDSFSELAVFLGIIIGFLFVFLGLAIFLMAYIIYKKNLREMSIQPDQTMIPLRFLFTITFGMIVITLLIALLLLFL